MLPVKVDMATDAPLKLALPPTKMPLWPAEMVPELLMPPEKVDIVTEAVVTPVPPTKMPLPPAEIIPELLMPPENAAMITFAALPVKNALA